MLQKALLVPFLIVLSALLFRILLYPDHLCRTAAMCCNCAEFILQGKVPYVDFVDLLPPSVFYWFVPPVFFANLLHTSITLTVLIFTWLLVAYSLICSFAVLRHRVKLEDWVVLLPLLFAFALFNLPVFLRFAEKEHLFVLAFMPFFLMRWLRNEDQNFNRFFSVAVGLLLGMAICIKPPQFFSLTIAPELYWWIKSKYKIHRLKDPEMLACITMIAANALTFLVAAPNIMRDAFLTRWLPLTKAGYGAYFCPTRDLFQFTADPNGPMIANCWALAAVVVCAFIIRKQVSLLMPLIVWTIAGWFVYLVQQKGWNYHTIPMLSGYFMLAGLELALTARWLVKKYLFSLTRLDSGQAKSILEFTTYCVLLSLSIPFLIRDSWATGTTSKSLEAVMLKYTHKHDPVLILSPSLSPAYPLLVKLDRKPASRHLHAYQLKMYEFLKFRSKNPAEKARYQNEENTIAQEIFQDIEKAQPTLIAISRESVFWDRNWTLFTSLQSAGFNRVLTDYRPTGLYNNCMVWLRLPHTTYVSSPTFAKVATGISCSGSRNQVLSTVDMRQP